MDNWRSFSTTISSSSKFRYAPTPSGYLHLGNGVNFVLNWLFARAFHKCPILLRIDDLDSARKRPSYVEDVFLTLDWLGLDYDEGPSGVADFEAAWSQGKRLQHYEDFLEKLKQQHLLFACKKSRKELATYSAFPVVFRQQGLSLEDPHSAWRIFGDSSLGIDDFIVRQKNKRPSYQVASLVDDLHFGTTHLIRGQDLHESTRMQFFLAEVSENFSFLQTKFWHHALIQDDNRQKLSKSEGASALKTLRTRGENPSSVYTAALRTLGLPERKLLTSHDLLEYFKDNLHS